MAVAGLRKPATPASGGVRLGAPLLAVWVLAAVAPLGAQVSPTEVRLDTADGIELFGDLNWSEEIRGRPLILLFHQGGSDAPGRHGSSMLNAARVDGDVEPTWTVVLDFLASVR